MDASSLPAVRIGFVPTYRFGFSPWCAKMREDSLKAFGKIEGMEVIAPGEAAEGEGPDPATGRVPHGAVHNLEEAEAVAEFFAARKVDGLIIGPLDFGDERSTAKVAELLGVPVLLYATAEPPAVDDASMARVSDSYCGTLSIASALYRRKLPFHFAGIFFPDDPVFAEEVEIFRSAVSVVKGLYNARIGQVGVRPGSFETVGYNETALIEKFGQNVIFAGLSDVTSRARDMDATDPRIAETVDAIKRSVAEVTVSDKYLDTAARLECALVDFWESNKLSAMAMQCWPGLGRELQLEACATFGRLTERGMLTACEADVVGALSMLVSHRSAMGATVPHFIDWTIKHREHDNRFLAWHCGNAPACLAADHAKTGLRSRRNMTGELPVDPKMRCGLHQFQIKPGAVTLNRLAEYDGQWKMLITQGEIVPSDENLAGTWAWVEVTDHDWLYRVLVEEGFIHHASMIHGDQADALELACKFLDIEPIVVE